MQFCSHRTACSIYYGISVNLSMGCFEPLGHSFSMLLLDSAEERCGMISCVYMSYCIFDFDMRAWYSGVVRI